MRDHTPPITQPALSARLADFLLVHQAELNEMFRIGAELSTPYRAWRKFRHAAKEQGFEPEHAWKAVKLHNITRTVLLPLLIQEDGIPFWFVDLPEVAERVHRIDRALGGGGPAVLSSSLGSLSDPEHLARLRIQTLMDEAAESAIIEGASRTRAQARELLRSNNPPRTVGDRMILNNYIALQRIKEWKARPLSREMLLELQEILTDGTLERADQKGRLRTGTDPVEIVDTRTNEVIFVPPLAELLPSLLDKLCEFANVNSDAQRFIHPVVKASILHFMIGYLHPFCDGNGRTARAVFFWFVLRSGYTIFEFMPISERIRAGYARYPQAYVDTEVEDGDLTHFVLYHLDIIEQSVRRLEEHLAQEQERIKTARSIAAVHPDLNLRQRLLLEHAIRHPTKAFTVKQHASANGITPATSRADLEGLVRAMLFSTGKRGREVLYIPMPDLTQRLSTNSPSR